VATATYKGPYAAQINRAARANGIDAWLLAALLSVESGFNPKARSATGDYGIAQINLQAHPAVTVAEAQNPAFAIPWAARYLAELKRSAGGSTTAALRAYNTGSTKPSGAGNSYASKVLGQRKTLLQQVGQAIASALNLGHGYAGVDQGVDFTGAGAIPALAAGTVTDIGSAHIVEGGSYPYLVYRLDAGPHKGRFVYVAEQFKPTVKVGQKVQAGQAIGVAQGGYPGIEVGFNKTPQGWNAVAPLPPKGQPTAAGQQMLAYLHSLAGHGSTGGAAANTVPVSFTGTLGKIGGAVTGAAGAVAGPLSGVGAAKGALDAATAAGKLAERILTDPGYIFLWVGFALVGLAFLFLGVERLLGRSATRDAGAGLATVAAPEAAPLLVGV
jgi:hypothetical protein